MNQELKKLDSELAKRIESAELTMLNAREEFNVEEIEALFDDESWQWFTNTYTTKDDTHTNTEEIFYQLIFSRFRDDVVGMLRNKDTDEQANKSLEKVDAFLVLIKC